MAETVDPAISKPRYEVRPSALQTPNAPEEFVDNSAKPLTFGDMLDAINPLQQLPLIGSLYRSITGATISPAARIVGGVLFGGLAGGVSAVANAVVEGISGKDISENLIAMVAPGKDAPSAPPVGVASDMPKPGESDGAGEATLQFAAYHEPADARVERSNVERGGLLTTWIPDAPRRVEPEAPRSIDKDMRVAAIPPGGISLAGLAPIRPAAAAEAAAPAPKSAAPDVAPSAPQLAAAAPTPGPTLTPQQPAASPSGSTAGPMRGMSLSNYRAHAISVLGAAAQAPAVDDRLGLIRKAEAARALTTQEAAQQAVAVVPATLQAQQAMDLSPQSYFAESMERGLARYRQMQLQRDSAASRGI
ncbi:MAG: hypothetical protein GC202_06585 [Alphaproteobacteria bacterium]|nr:hypothetical protein [Alphaproteobacteria bacterium]